MDDDKTTELDKKDKDANFCIGAGVGVGVVGAGAAAVLGATCPICFIAAPALVGIGMVEKVRVAKKKSKEDREKKED